jgi:hypothetical protein
MVYERLLEPRRQLHLCRAVSAPPPLPSHNPVTNNPSRNGTVDEYSLHKTLSEPSRTFKFPSVSGPVSAVRAMPNGRTLIWYVPEAPPSPKLPRNPSNTPSTAPPTTSSANTTSTTPPPPPSAQTASKTPPPHPSSSSLATAQASSRSCTSTPRARS